MDNSEIPVIDNKNTEVSNETSATKMQSPAAESSNIETGDINQLDQITESGIQGSLMEHENINEEDEHEDIGDSENPDISQTEKPTEEQDGETMESTEPGEAPIKLVKLPISRLKAIIKTVPSVQLVNSEAIALIGKATENFIAEFVTSIHGVTLESGKKTLTKAHLDQVVQHYPQFEFLDGMLS